MKANPKAFALEIGERIRELDAQDGAKEEMLKESRLKRKDEMAAIHEALVGFVGEIVKVMSSRRSYGDIQAYWDPKGNIVFRWGTILAVMFEASSEGILWRSYGQASIRPDRGTLFPNFPNDFDYQALELIKQLVLPLL